MVYTPTARGQWALAITNLEQEGFPVKKPSNSRFVPGVKDLLEKISDMQVSLYAANAGYFLILSVFPALVLILSLLRYTGIQVDTFASLLEGVLPEALLPAAQRLILNTYVNTTSTVVGLSAVASLWSASRGMYCLLTGLNAIYGVSENRSWLHTRFISMIYTFLFLLVLLLTLVLHVFGTTILGILSQRSGWLANLLANVVDLRFFLLLFTQTLLFTAMFMVLPNGRNRLENSLPGALLASIGWLIFSDLYSIYVEHFTSLSIIYGSVYAVALSMLWLYCCLSILFYGGVLNRFLRDRRRT